MESLNLTEGQFPGFLKTYMTEKIDKRLADSFYDYELLLTK